jgi:hypothetical protein
VAGTVRRWQVALLFISMTLMVRLGAADIGMTEPRPILAMAAGVPTDFVHLARATWTRFTEAFPARQGCLAPLTVDASWELDDRAVYYPRQRLVAVRIPGTAPNLTATLVHEFAHHLEFTCRGAHRAFRPTFLAAQGLPPDSPWFQGVTWERTPSEQFAEATTEFVLGRRHAHRRTAATDEAIQAIRNWARGN